MTANFGEAEAACGSPSTYAQSFGSSLSSWPVFRGPIFISLLPFLLGLVLATFMSPRVLVRSVARTARAIAAAVALGLLVIVVGYLGTWIATEMANELIELSRLLPTHQRTAMDIFNQVMAWGQNAFQELPDEVQTYLQDSVQNLARSATEWAGTIINRVLGTIAGVPTATLIIVIGIVATYFFAKDRDIVNPALLRLLPLRMRQTAAEARQDLGRLGRLFQGTAHPLHHQRGASRHRIVIRQHEVLDRAVVDYGVSRHDPHRGTGLHFGTMGGLRSLYGRPAASHHLVGVVRHHVCRAASAAAEALGRLGRALHPLMMLLALWAGLVTVGVWGFIVGPVVVIVAKAVHNAGLFKTEDDEEADIAAEEHSEPVSAEEPVVEAGAATTQDQQDEKRSEG